MFENVYEKRESEGKASIEEKIVKLMDLVHYFVSEHNVFFV